MSQARLFTKKETARKKRTEDQLITAMLAETRDEYDAFEKKRSHFGKAKNFGLTDDAKHHSVKMFKKKEKENSSSDYSQSDWLEITSDLPAYRTVKVFFRFLTAMGDIVNSEMGHFAPKYRYVVNNVGEYKLLSKRIPNGATVFGDFFDEKILPKIKKEQSDDPKLPHSTYEGEEDCEGVGVSYLLKVILYDDDDAHFGNFMKTEVKGKVFVSPIDWDHSLWPLSDTLYSKRSRSDMESEKVMQYLSGHPKAIWFPDDEKGEDTSKIKGLKQKHIGRQREENYQSAPVGSFKTPYNDQFMTQHAKAYSIAASKSKVVPNEINYHRIKTSLTLFLRKFIVDFHFTREEPLQRFGRKMRKKIVNIGTTAKKLCQTSDTVKRYLEANRLSVIKTILYDWNTFFYDNPHYLTKKQDVWKTMWLDIVDLIVGKFDKLLAVHGLDVLTAAELKEIRQYADKCENNYTGACKEAVTFYQQQEREAFAANELEQLKLRLEKRPRRFLRKEKSLPEPEPLRESIPRACKKRA